MEDGLYREGVGQITFVENGSTKIKEFIDTTRITEFRPWGSYTILDEGPRYKVKRLEVNPKQRLSLQYHNSRAEVWTVVAGTALLQVGEKENVYFVGECILVPSRAIHRISNQADEKLIIIEAQIGTCDEADIVRLEDIYGRTSNE